MKLIYFLPIILILYLFYNQYDHKLSSSKAKKMISKGEIDYIIDVRTVEEWNKGHHPKAIHIPMGTFPNNMNKESVILIYCRTGRRAKIAVQQYIKRGYKNIYYIEGDYKSII